MLSFVWRPSIQTVSITKLENFSGWNLRFKFEFPCINRFMDLEILASHWQDEKDEHWTQAVSMQEIKEMAKQDKFENFYDIGII